MAQQKTEKINVVRELLEILTRNFWLKFLSVVFSIFLFFIVRTDKEISFERVATIKIITPQDITVIGGKTRFVNVNIRLENSLFSNPPSPYELTAEYIIDREELQKYKVKITRENFTNLSKHYQLTVENPYFEIETDRIKKKELPIKVVLKGNPSPEYLIDSVTLVPDKIEVSGSEKDFAGVTGIDTNPINVDGINSNLTTIIPIQPKENSSLSYERNSVQVSIALKNNFKTRTVKSLPIIIKNLPFGVEAKSVILEPKIADITVSGAPNLVDKLKPEDLVVYVDGADLQDQSQERKLIFLAPEGVQVIALSPDLVTIKLSGKR